MPRSLQGPLTDADYERLNSQLTNLTEVMKNIEVGKAAGLDCSAEDQACRDYFNRLSQIKRAYFPDRP